MDAEHDGALLCSAGADAGAARERSRSSVRSPSRKGACARGGGGPLSGCAGGTAHDELPLDLRDRRAGRSGDARRGPRRRPAPRRGGALCALRRHGGSARGGVRGHRAVAHFGAAHLGDHCEIGLPRRPLRRAHRARSRACAAHRRDGRLSGRHCRQLRAPGQGPRARRGGVAGRRWPPVRD